MKHEHSIDKLNEAIETAERVLQDIEEDDSRKAKRKRKRINKALEHAYESLNKENCDDKELDKRTDEVWDALIDDDHYMLLLIFFLGFTLSGAIIFTVFQAFSFIEDSSERLNRPITQEVADLIEVNYKEDSIVNLYDQMTVPDRIGLQNPPEEFSISNSSEKVGSLNYLVHYSVNIVPMNDPSAKLIDKKYIKYKYFYTDSETNRTYESPIGTLADLKENPDGSLVLIKGAQLKDRKTDFKVIFWLGSEATNKEQGKTYTFQFKVNAAIARG